MSNIYPCDFISHATVSVVEGLSLQKDMNFCIKGFQTVILMSALDTKDLKVSPKTLDQSCQTIKGALTENGKFFQDA